MNGRKMTSTMNDDRPPPCELSGRCKYYQLCARNKVACPKFAWYVGSMEGRSLRAIPEILHQVPRIGVYRRTYGDGL